MPSEDDMVDDEYDYTEETINYDASDDAEQIHDLSELINNQPTTTVQLPNPIQHANYYFNADGMPLANDGTPIANPGIPSFDAIPVFHVPQIADVDAPFDIDFTLTYFKKRDANNIVDKRCTFKIADCCECKKEIIDNGREIYFRYGLKDLRGESNQYYCLACKDKFVKCPACAKSFRPNEIKFEHCPNCINNAPTKLIQQYSTKAERSIEKQGSPKDELFSGIELELESSDYGLDTLRVNALVKKFAILKRDSSIKQGFEIVSAPASLDVHRVQWQKFFDEVPETATAQDTCGMHVHISRVRLSDLQVAKMLKFLHNPKNETFITSIAGRSSSFHNDFKKEKSWRDGRDGGRNQADMDRHTALNLNNTNTIEFRIFAATKSYHIFIKNIEFCYALVKFTNWGQASIQEAIQFSNFYKFVRQYRKDYPYLYKFLMEENIFTALKSLK